MPDSQWHCATCNSVEQLSDARVKAQKFGCARPVDLGVCGGGLERVTVELAEKLAAEKKVSELMQGAPKPEGVGGFCPACGWSTEARLAAVLARDRAELRDKFACAALAGMLARDDAHKLVSMHASIAELAYRLADAMLDERALLPRDHAAVSPERVKRDGTK